MDRSGRWVALAALAISVATAVGTLVLSSGPAAEVEGSASSLADLERRLARLEAADARPVLAPAPAPVVVAGDGAVESRVAALERRLEELASSATRSPSPALESLSDAELLARARATSADPGTWKGTDAMEALRTWEEVLRRNRSGEAAGEAWEKVGYAYRHLKDHEKEEAAFREALRVASDPGRESAMRFQLAWAQVFGGDTAGALESMAEVARSRGTSRDLRGHALLNEARWSLETGDRARARRAYEDVLREHSGSTDSASDWLVERAREHLKKIEGR
jgi:tetratricopeptide (TPR) repeat protein